MLEYCVIISTEIWNKEEEENSNCKSFGPTFRILQHHTERTHNKINDPYSFDLSNTIHQHTNQNPYNLQYVWSYPTVDNVYKDLGQTRE